MSVSQATPVQTIFDWIRTHQNHRDISQLDSEYVMLTVGLAPALGRPCVFRLEARDAVDGMREQFVFARIYELSKRSTPSEEIRFVGAGIFFEIFDQQAVVMPSRLQAGGTAIARDITAQNGRFGFSEIFLARPKNIPSPDHQRSNLAKDIRLEWQVDASGHQVIEALGFDLSTGSAANPIVRCVFN